MSSNKAEKYANWRASHRPYMLAAVAAIVMFVLIAPIIQDGDSMGKTAADGNVVILHKTTFSEKRGVPEYDDVVVFKEDFYKDNNKGAHVLGRVIGVSGDTIEIRDGDVYRNNKKLKHKSYEQGEITENLAPVEVGSGKVFILNDNRDNSIDSRNAEVGMLNLKGIRGKAVFVLWPFSNFGMI
jgi:signal peptidase I